RRGGRIKANRRRAVGGGTGRARPSRPRRPQNRFVRTPPREIPQLLLQFHFAPPPPSGTFVSTLRVPCSLRAPRPKRWEPVVRFSRRPFMRRKLAFPLLLCLLVGSAGGG